MKKISIDVRMIHHSGIGTYLRNILPYLIMNRDLHYYILGNKDELLNYSWSRNNNITLMECGSGIYTIHEQKKLIEVIPKGTDLFWSPHYNIPIFYRGKLLVTVHDVFHLAMPHFVHGVIKRLYAKSMFAMVKHKADAIITVSNFTAQEIKKYIGRGSNVHVIPNGVDSLWFHDKSENNPFGHPFILYVGNVKPHKNLKSLILAFKKIIHAIPHHLVIVGEKDGFITGDKEILKLSYGLQNRIIFTGRVDDYKLRQYYAHADVFVFPSLYEGFGLPPLEAMASGCPVIVSHAASLPEVCGDAAIYCDPYDINDIANKILLVLQNRELRESLIHKGLQQARNFTWEDAAQKTLAVIKELLGE